MWDDIEEFLYNEPINRLIEQYDQEVYQPTVNQFRRDNPNTPQSGAGLPSPGQVNASTKLGDLIYGSSEGLSEEEGQRLSQLTNRFRRLQPMQSGQYGSAPLAGNPYSWDTRGLFTGIGDAVAGIVNKERSDRIYGNEQRANRPSRVSQLLGKEGMEELDRRAERYSGFYDEMEGLQERKTSAAEAEEGKREFMAKNLMDALGSARDHGEAVELQLMENAGKTGSGTPFAPSAINRFVDLMRSRSDIDTMGLEELLEQRQTIQDNSWMSDEEKQSQLNNIDQDINSVTNRIIQSNTEVAELMKEMGVVPNVDISNFGNRNPGNNTGNNTGETEPAPFDP